MEKKIIIVNLLDRYYKSIWNQFASQFKNLETRLYSMFVEGFKDQWKDSELKVTSCGKTEIIKSKKLFIDTWTGTQVSDSELADAVKGLLKQGMRFLVSEEAKRILISPCLPYDE